MLEFSAHIKQQAMEKGTLYTLSLASDALADIEIEKAQPSCGQTEKMKIASRVYSDIHKTLDGIHARIDQVARNYLLAVGAIVSFVVGSRGAIDGVALWLVPIFLGVATLQVGLMLKVTSTFRRQQEKIVQSMGHSGNPLDSLFQISHAPKQGPWRDFRTYGLGFLFLSTLLLLLCSPMWLQRISPSSLLPTSPIWLTGEAWDGDVYFETEAGETLRLKCFVTQNQSINCQKK